MRETASASAVPSTHDTAAVPSPMTTLLRSGSVIDGSDSASPNHFVEQPSQLSTCRPPLKANTTTTAIGAYRNAYTAHAYPRSARLPTELLLAAAQAHVEQRRHRHRRDQHHRDRRAERPVAREQELLADQVP